MIIANWNVGVHSLIEDTGKASHLICCMSDKCHTIHFMSGMIYIHTNVMVLVMDSSPCQNTSWSEFPHLVPMRVS